LAGALPFLLLAVGFFVPLGAQDSEPVSPQYEVRSIAGGLLPGYGGDDGPSEMASLDWPRGLDIDGMGNVYIADSLNCRIRKIDTEGIITTVIGNGECGVGSEEADPLLSPLNVPIDVAVNDMGEIYFTESTRIRKLDADGLVFTVGGTRPEDVEFCSDADMVDAYSACLRPRYLDLAPDGTIYFSDGFVPDRVRKIDVEGQVSTVAGTQGVGFAGDGMLATSALLNGPQGVIYHEGYIYIADSLNYRIRCVDPQGVISTVAGTGEIGGLPDGVDALLANVSPEDLWFDDLNQRLLFTNLSTGSVLELDDLGLVNVVIGPRDSETPPDILAENTPGRQTRVRTPRGLAVDLETGDIVYSEGNPPENTFPGPPQDPTLTAAARIRRAYADGIGCLLPFPGNFTGTVGVPFLESFPYESEMLETVMALGLPPGLMASTDEEIHNVVIEGTPTQAGVFDVTLTLSCGARSELSISIEPPGCLFVTESPLPQGDVGSPYSTPILYSSAGLQTISLVSGELPPGLMLVAPIPESEVATWRIEGIPTQAGLYTFVLGLNPCEGLKEYQLTVVGSGLQLTTTMLPSANVGCGYGATILASNGVPPYSFRLLSENLFAGMTLAPDGRVSGAPTEAGERTLIVEVIDSLEQSAQGMIDFLVGERIVWVTNSLPDGVVGQPYPNTTLEATGGLPPRAFTAITELPLGMSLNPQGLLAGTPSAPFLGDVQFRLDTETGCSADTLIPLRISAPGPTELELTSDAPAVELLSEYEAVVNTNAPATANLTGSLVLTFTSAVEEGRDNPEVAFATDPRSRSVSFTVPEAQTRAQFVGGDSIRFNSGTVAGTIVLEATIPNGEGTLSDSLEYTIPATPPRILSMTLARSGTTLTLTATGFAPRRKITGGTLELVPRTGVTLSGPSTISLASLGDVFQTYFQTEDSRNFGSQFVLNLPLTVTGGTANDIAELRLTLVGESGENSNTQSAQ